MGISTYSAEPLPLPNSECQSSAHCGPFLAAAALPDEPLVTIESSRKWLPLSFGDLWNTASFLYF